MNFEFWKQRWAEGRIAFHEGAPNHYLSAHAGRLRGRVLVPLCGKTEDLAYLASRGHDVIGVELVEDAVAAFFAEHGLTPTVDEPWNGGTHRVYRGGGVTIVAGDWFGVTRELIGAIDSVYDRAAMVALPPDLRPRYVTHLRGLAGAGSPGLLVTVAYDQARFEGPPFSVEDAEVRSSFAQVEQLAEGAADGRLGAANIGALERCYATVL